MRQGQQTTGYAVALKSPHERAVTGKYWIEKLIDAGTAEERWVCMSFGDSDHDAAPGQELDRLIRRGIALEGKVRIVRLRDRVLVWESAS